jgi:hypothetical protein
MDDSRTAIIGGAGRRWSVSQAADLLSVTTKTIYGTSMTERWVPFGWGHDCCVYRMQNS